jgi:hypothetical protein
MNDVAHNRPIAPVGRIWRAGLLVVALAGLLMVNMLYLTEQSRHYQLFMVKDFSHYGWLSGRVVLGGGDPYQAREWLRTHWTPEYDREIGTDYTTGNIVYVNPTRPGALFDPAKEPSDLTYPIWVAYLFAPLASLSLDWAQGLMMLLDEIGIFIGLWCACRLLGFRPPLYLIPILALLTIGFRPTLRVLQEGGFTGLVFPAFLAAVLLIRARRAPWLAGALLAFCTIKLQVTVVILVFVLLWLLRQRRGDVIAWTGVAGLVLWGLPTLFRPQWISEWLTILRLHGPTVFVQPTLWSLWVTFLGPYWWLIGILVTLGLGLGLLRYWRSDLVTGRWDSLPGTLIVALPMTLYSWDYDQIFLLVPWLACWAWAAIGDSGSARLWRYALILWALVLPLYPLLPIPRNEEQTYGLLLPATLLVLYTLARRRAPGATASGLVEARGGQSAPGIA